MTYLDMLQEWLFPQLQDEPNFIWQQDGTPPHWHNYIRAWLNDVVTDCWIGHHGLDDRAYLQWSPRSRDFTPCDFFLWGFLKDKVYVPPLPANLPELRDRIRKAVVAVTPDMRINVWEELAYRLDVCHVTNGAHIEHL